MYTLFDGDETVRQILDLANTTDFYNPCFSIYDAGICRAVYNARSNYTPQEMRDIVMWAVWGDRKPMSNKRLKPVFTEYRKLKLGKRNFTFE